MTIPMYKKSFSLFALLLILGLVACDKEEIPENVAQWEREPSNPVLRDTFDGGGYEGASDGHIFFDDDGQLRMLYSGDHNGNSSIKLANGSSWTSWSKEGAVLFETGPSGLDVNKETCFYRKANSGKHQIYYIGYDDEVEYRAQVYLAEADSLEGPYTLQSQPVVPVGQIAGKPVHLITSPSIVEHEGVLYMAFLGWDAPGESVTKVWVLGATSTDDGHTWGNYEEVDVPIGMEGQVTKTPSGGFVAVNTAAFADVSAIFYSTADHPFGPWRTQDDPIIIRSGSVLEQDETIAPQITYDPVTGEEVLYYTGANYPLGWWMMVAYPN